VGNSSDSILSCQREMQELYTGARAENTPAGANLLGSFRQPASYTASHAKMARHQALSCTPSTAPVGRWQCGPLLAFPFQPAASGPYCLAPPARPQPASRTAIYEARKQHTMNSALNSSTCKQPCMSNWLQLPKQHHGLLQDLLARATASENASENAVYCSHPLHDEVLLQWSRPS